MIPDFKTYIKESIWTNINKRSEGSISRKEDDINDLDFESFYDYVKSKYNVTMYNIGYAIGENGEPYTYIPVLIYGEGENHYVYHLCRDFYPQDTVTLNIEVKYLDRDLYNKLKERFSVSNYNRDFLKIRPKGGGRIDNNFYIEVVEYIIDVANEDVINVYRKS
jgi:hypothetical protein